MLALAQKGDKSFEDLAKEYSEDSISKISGGDLGWVPRGKITKELEDVIFSNKDNKGQIFGDIVKTENGFYVIKMGVKDGSVIWFEPRWYPFYS